MKKARRSMKKGWHTKKPSRVSGGLKSSEGSKISKPFIARGGYRLT